MKSARWKRGPRPVSSGRQPAAARVGLRPPELARRTCGSRERRNECRTMYDEWLDVTCGYLLPPRKMGRPLTGWRSELGRCSWASCRPPSRQRPAPSHTESVLRIHRQHYPSVGPTRLREVSLNQSRGPGTTGFRNEKPLRADAEAIWMQCGCLLNLRRLEATAKGVGDGSARALPSGVRSLTGGWRPRRQQTHTTCGVSSS